MAGCLCLLPGCINRHTSPPSGLWQSRNGRPSILITDSQTVIVFHISKHGQTLPLEYPMRRDMYGYWYIKAQCRIFMSYNEDDNSLFLSPGGMYYFKEGFIW